MKDEHDTLEDTHDAVEDTQEAVEDTHDAMEEDSDSDLSGEWDDIPGIDDPPAPIKEPRTVSWDVSISDTDFEKLIAGFIPENMDERWGVTAEDPDPNGNISVHIIRSFAREFYVLHLKRGDNGGGAEINAITWEQNQGGYIMSEEEAKMDVVHKFRGILGCDFEALPKYKYSKDTHRLVIADSA